MILVVDSQLYSNKLLLPVFLTEDITANQYCMFNVQRHDIALLALDTPIRNVPVIKLPVKSSKPPDYAGTQATIAGWGETSFSNKKIIVYILIQIRNYVSLFYPLSEGKVSNNLLKATVTVLTNAVCSKSYSGINSKQICATAPGKDTCQVCFISYITFI